MARDEDLSLALGPLHLVYMIGYLQLWVALLAWVHEGPVEMGLLAANGFSFFLF